MGEKNEAETVAELATKAARGVEMVDVENSLGEDLITIASVPAGLVLHSIKPFLDEWLDRPRRKEGIAVLQTVDSLVDHANRHKTEHSAVFVDRYGQTPKIVAVLDYHEVNRMKAGPEPAVAGELSIGLPAFGRHRGRYDFPFSDEWKAWADHCGKEMNQEAFAEFIEVRIVDLIDTEHASKQIKAHAQLLGLALASPSRMVELSRGLTIHEGKRVQNMVNLSSGEAKCVFVTEHQGEDGAALKIPGAFLIAIPVFRGGDAYQVFVRLRYRLRGGSLTWIYELVRPQDVVDSAMDEAIDEVKAGTSLPIYLGSPE